MGTAAFSAIAGTHAPPRYGINAARLALSSIIYTLTSLAAGVGRVPATKKERRPDLPRRSKNRSVMVAVLALVVAGVFALAVLVLILDVLRRLFWFALRLGASAAAALTVGVTAAGLSIPEQTWIAAPAALAAGALILWFSRKWGQGPTARSSADVTAPACNQLLFCDAERSAADRVSARHPASSLRAPLLDAALRHRLATTENALARAGRDNLGQPAAEWLEFWRRRVPDLIAAAQDVWDDADPSEQASVAQRLVDHLHAIIDEADARLAAVKNARRDLFSIRGNHADGRVRDG